MNLKQCVFCACVCLCVLVWVLFRVFVWVFVFALCACVGYTLRALFVEVGDYSALNSVFNSYLRFNIKIAINAGMCSTLGNQ